MVFAYYCINNIYFVFELLKHGKEYSINSKLLYALIHFIYKISITGIKAFSGLTSIYRYESIKMSPVSKRSTTFKHKLNKECSQPMITETKKKAAKSQVNCTLKKPALEQEESQVSCTLESSLQLSDEIQLNYVINKTQKFSRKCFQIDLEVFSYLLSFY